MENVEENNADKVELTVRGGTKLLVPRDIYNNEEELIAFVARERERLGIPRPEAATRTTNRTSISNPSPANYAMEFVTSVNRAGAQVADIATSPVQLPVEMIRQRTLSPQGQGWFSSIVPERGAFAGDDAATRIIAGAGELASMAVPSGMFTRGLSNLVSKAATLPPTTFSRVLQELGKTTAKQDVGFGLLSGVGGEAAVEVFGENEIARFGGQVLTPAAWTLTAARLINHTKNFLTQAAPSIDELKGLKTAFYTMIDESGAKLDTPDIRPFMGKIDKLTADYNLEGAGNSRVSGILNNLRRAAEDGELTFSRLLNDTQKLRQIPYDAVGGEGVIAYNISKELEEPFFNWKPRFPAKLKGKTTQEVLSMAKELNRRTSNARILENLLGSTDLAQKAGAKFIPTLKAKLRTLIDPDSSSSFRTGVWNDREKALIESALESKNLTGLYRLFENVGFNSEDFLKTMVYSSIIGASTGVLGAGQGMMAATALGTTAFAKAMNSLANRAARRNANLLRGIINAGDNAELITSSYLRHTPKGKHDPRELAGLLVQQRVPLGSLVSKDGKTFKGFAEGKSPLIQDSILLAIGADRLIQKEQREAEQQQNLRTGSQDVPRVPIGF